MVCEDLLPVKDKMFTLLGVSGQCGAGHGQFQTKVEFDGGIDHGIETEDLLLSLGVLGITSNADPGIRVGWELRAAKEKRIFFGPVIQGNFSNEAPLDDKIEIGLLEFILKIEDLVEDAGVLVVGLLKAKGQDLHPWSGDI